MKELSLSSQLNLKRLCVKLNQFSEREKIAVTVKSPDLSHKRFVVSGNRMYAFPYTSCQRHMHYIHFLLRRPRPSLMASNAV